MSPLPGQFGEAVTSIASARISKAFYVFCAGILISLSIHENSKHIYGLTSATDISVVMEVIKVNKDLMVGVISGYLIGMAHTD